MKIDLASFSAYLQQSLNSYVQKINYLAILLFNYEVHTLTHMTTDHILCT